MTPAQVAEKDRQYAELAAADAFPIKDCLVCLKRYYACKTCGNFTFAEFVAQQPCRSCGGKLEYKESRICCRKDNHHLYDCCLHCGNDERGGLRKS